MKKDEILSVNRKHNELIDRAYRLFSKLLYIDKKGCLPVLEEPFDVFESLEFRFFDISISDDEREVVFSEKYIDQCCGAHTEKITSAPIEALYYNDEEIFLLNEKTRKIFDNLTLDIRKLEEIKEREAELEIEEMRIKSFDAMKNALATIETPSILFNRVEYKDYEIYFDTKKEMISLVRKDDRNNVPYEILFTFDGKRFVSYEYSNFKRKFIKRIMKHCLNNGVDKQYIKL